MKHILCIILGSSLGALSRYGLSKIISQSVTSLFPWGTLLVNMSGSFLIGFVFILVESSFLNSYFQYFIMIGFLGAYTTFSTYTLETMNLIKTDNYLAAGLNFLLSNGLGLIFVFLGIIWAKMILKSIK